MSKLLEELQLYAANHDTDAASLFRRARIVAVKLQQRAATHWIDAELNGYTCQPDELPPYRKLKGTLKAFNPYRGWIPVQLEVSELEDLVTQTPISQGIGSIEKSLIGKHPNLVFPISADLRTALGNMLETDFHLELRVNPSALHSLIDHAKNLVLNWSLKLEEEGVKDDQTKFTFEDRVAANRATMMVIHGSVGNIGAISENLSLSDNSQIKITSETQKLDELANGISQIIHALEEKERERIQSLLDETIETSDVEVKKDKLQSIRNIAEGATGSAIWSLIASALSSI